MFRSKKSICIYWIVTLLIAILGLVILEGNVYFRE